MSIKRRLLDYLANWSFTPDTASVGDVPTWDGNDFILQAQQGGGGLPSWFQSGSGSPVGTVTPSQQGALYQDTTNGALYEAVGATSADWFCLGGVALADGTIVGLQANPIAKQFTLFVADGANTGGFELTDTVSALAGNYNGFSYSTTGVEGGQRAAIVLGSMGQFSWVWKPDGGLQLPNGNSLYNAAAAPDNAVGADGDWALGADGHIYHRAAGSWSQKV